VPSSHPCPGFFNEALSDFLFLNWVEITSDLSARSSQELRVNVSGDLPQALDRFNQSLYIGLFKSCRDANSNRVQGIFGVD
jgi:hypothetical protein